MKILFSRPFLERWAGPILLIIIFFLAARYGVGLLTKDPYTPVRIMTLEVEPKTLEVGQTARLFDGLCNDSGQPLTIQLYLGAQQIEGSALAARTIDLLTRLAPDGITRVPVTDTEEGRLSLTLPTGCTLTRPLVGPVPPQFTPGTWRLRIHVVVHGPNGQDQDLPKLSKPFEVRPR